MIESQLSLRLFQSELTELVGMDKGVQTGASIDDYKKLLTQRIFDMLISERDHLVSLAYRFDVNEAAFWAACKKNNLEHAADAVADVFMNREIEKLRTRIDHEQRQQKKRAERTERQLDEAQIIDAEVINRD